MRACRKRERSASSLSAAELQQGTSPDRRSLESQMRIAVYTDGRTSLTLNSFGLLASTVERILRSNFSKFSVICKGICH